ncbi:MAG TPA: hypothetical protein VFP13_10710 [Actinomycetota bacterium]|nr:hypothetical protein [Actinomycetota bacterium]
MRTTRPKERSVDAADAQPPGTPRPDEPSASVVLIALQVAAYAGVAMGLVGTVALVATARDPSETMLLLVAVAVTAGLFAAGIAIGGHPDWSTQRLRSILWFAALLGWSIVVETVLVVAEVDLEGRSRPLLSAILVAPVAVGLWIGLLGPCSCSPCSSRCTRSSPRPCSRSPIRSGGPTSRPRPC